MRDITLKELLEAGCHFGHQTNRWHPKASWFIFGSRSGVHVIDLVKTREGLLAAGRYLRDLARSGGSVVFVGTKRQAKAIVSEQAAKIRDSFPKESNFYYLLERWPGGLLTNFDVISKNNLDAIVKLSEDIVADRFVTKKEKLLASRKLSRYQRVYGGLVGLSKVPSAIFLVDIRSEAGAVKEAQRAGITMVAIVDTNTNPDPVQYPIPANDDAVGSIKIIVEYLAEAWIEGLNMRKDSQNNQENQDAKPQ